MKNLHSISSPGKPTRFRKAARIVFLGDTDVGKSHIVSRLLSSGQSNEKNVGSVSPYLYEFDLLNGIKVPVHIWDFSDDEIRHHMYRMFLTTGTIYAVVISVQDDTQNERALHWLHTIQQFAPDSPVILILTKTDLNPNAIIKITTLQHKFPQLCCVTKLSGWNCSTTDFKNAVVIPLRKEVARFTDQPADAYIPWLKLERKLMDLSSTHISNNTFRELMAECSVDRSPETLETLIQRYHSLGLCFHHCRANHLSDSVILRPEWITNALFTLLKFKPDSASTGLIRRKEIISLLVPSAKERERIHLSYPEIRYMVQDVDFILHVLHKFRLAFEMKDGLEFIPMLCKTHPHPIENDYADKERTLEFRQIFPYPTEELLHRLMKDCFKELDQESVWLTGARFVRRNVSALVRSERNVLRILVQSTDIKSPPHKYLQELRNALNKIAAELLFPDGDGEIVYGEGRLQEHFSCNLLFERLEKGESQLFSKEFQRPILIRDILKQIDHQTQVRNQKLLDDIARGCIRLQDGGISAGDGRCTNALRDHLSSLGYSAELPLLTGNDTDAQSALLITNEAGRPWTALESTMVKDALSSSMRVWEQRLSNLLRAYIRHDLPFLFLISYVSCGKDQYYDLWHAYSDRMRRYDPDRCECIEGTYDEVSPLPGAHDLRIDKCTYDCGSATATVYHYFLRLEIGTPAQATPQTSKKKEIKAGKKASKSSDYADSRQPASEEAASYEYRVIILGDSEAGKSQIFFNLHYPKEDPKNFLGGATKGIEIFHKYYDILGHRVRVNFWDFGGQEILHSMHRIFMADQTMYVIVLNTRNDNHDAQANFWMRYVQTYAHNAPVIFVLNKIDENEHATLNLPALRRKFHNHGNILEVIRLSAKCWSMKKFQTEFTNKLLDHIGRSLNAANKLSDQAIRIRERLSRENADIIESNEVRAIFRAEGLLNEEEQNALMNRFHSSGFLVCFDTEMKMLLKPEWFTKILYRILNPGQTASTNGLLTRSDISKLARTNQDGSPSENHIEFILLVMRFYGFSFEHSATSKTEFIPTLCRRDEPDEVQAFLESRDMIEMQLQFEYLPLSVIHKLILQRHMEIDEKNTWLYGAMLHKGSDSYAVIRKEDNTLLIYTCAHNKRAAVTYLENILDDIDKCLAGADQKNLLLRKLIRYEIDGTPQYFDYQQLMNAEKCKVRYVAPSEGTRSIAVQDILDQTDSRSDLHLQELLRLIKVGCIDLQTDHTFWFRKPLVDSEQKKKQSGKGKNASDKEKKPKSNAPKMDENARNRQLKRRLETRFIVADQSEGGEGSTGTNPGEMDLVIRIVKDTPWTILEALNVEGKKSIGNWTEHLNRLVKNYNKPGLENLILLSYLKCNQDEFGSIRETYLTSLCNHSLPTFGLPIDCKPDFLNTNAEYIHVTQATYSCDGVNLYVYHYLVLIPTYDPQDPKQKA